MRIASTGSNLDADKAGNIPETNPIVLAINMPMDILNGDNIKVKLGTKAFNPINPKKTIIIPINPPNTDKITASNKNCSNINRFLAPKAF